MQIYSKDGVRQERTGWRCQAISERHRHWGYNCPAVDLDFVMAEYNHGKPVALIEYKEKTARQPSLNHPTYNAIRNLADLYSGCQGGLPFFVVFYCPQDWWYRVIPGNAAGAAYLLEVEQEHATPIANVPITEQWFVYLLYRLRKITLTQADREAIAALNNVLPTMSEAA